MANGSTGTKRRFFRVSGLCLCCAMWCGFSASSAAGPGSSSIAETSTQSSSHAWVEQTLKAMSLEEKVGQMLQVRVYGDYRSFDSPDFAAVREQILTCHIGSVDLGARMAGPNLVKSSPEQVAAITNELQRTSKLPLLVGGGYQARSGVAALRCAGRPTSSIAVSGRLMMAKR